MDRAFQSAAIQEYMREAHMWQIVNLSLTASLVIGSCGAAAATDVSTWRWQVSQCLREQQAREADTTKIFREASAFEVTPGMQQRSDLVLSADPLYSGELRALTDSQRSGQ
jgi:hypothetical protein